MMRVHRIYTWKDGVGKAGISLGPGKPGDGLEKSALEKTAGSTGEAGNGPGRPGGLKVFTGPGLFLLGVLVFCLTPAASLALQVQDEAVDREAVADTLKTMMDARESPGIASNDNEPGTARQRPEELDILERYFRMAAEHNPELASIGYSADAQYQRARRMGVLPDPEVNLGYFPSLPQQGVLPDGVGGVAGRFQISAMQMFPWFGTLGTREEVAGQMGDARQHELTSRQLELFQEIQEVWFEYSRIELSIRTVEEMLAIVRDLEELVRTRFETGQTSQADLLRIQMEADRLQTRLENIRDRKEPLREQFMTVLGVDEQVDIEVPARLPERHLGQTRDELMQLALQRNPEFDRIESVRQSYRAEEDLARLEGMPSFGVGVEVMGRDFSTMSMMPDMNETVVGMATVRVPLFRERYRAQREEAQMEIRRTQQQERNMGNRLRSDLESAMNRLRDAQREEELISGNLLSRTEQALEILMEDYSVGRVTFDEVLQVQRELLDLELERLQQLARQNKAMARIERITAMDR